MAGLADRDRAQHARPVRWPVTAALAVELGVAAVALAMNRRGASKLAARLLGASIPILAAALMIVSGYGFRDVSVLLLPASLVVCGLLLEPRTLVALTVLNVFCAVAVIAIEAAGLLPLTTPRLVYTRGGLDAAMILVLTSVGVGVVSGHAAPQPRPRAREGGGAAPVGGALPRAHRACRRRDLRRPAGRDDRGGEPPRVRAHGLVARRAPGRSHGAALPARRARPHAPAVRVDRQHRRTAGRGAGDALPRRLSRARRDELPADAGRQLPDDRPRRERAPAGRAGAARPRGAAAPGAEDGGGGPPGRRRRPRLQQPAHRDHRQPDPRHARRRRGVAGPALAERGGRGGLARGGPHPTAPRFQPQADHRAARPRPARGRRRTAADARAAHRRGRRARHDARRRRLPRGRRPGPDRAGAAEPRRERPRRDAVRRPADPRRVG